jgi:hypothetical protein
MIKKITPKNNPLMIYPTKNAKIGKMNINKLAHITWDSGTSTSTTSPTEAPMSFFASIDKAPALLK